METTNFSKSLNFEPCIVNINYILEPIFKITSINLESLLEKKPKVLKDNYMPDKKLDRIISSITAYFEKDKPFQLRLQDFDMEQISPFYRKVLITLFDKVHHGKVTTYQKLAELSGNPKASRAAGTAMATNPFPLLIPCHRVLKSDFTIGNYGSGPELKLYLLEKETGKYSFTDRSLSDRKIMI